LLPSTDKADLGLRRGDIDGLDTAYIADENARPSRPATSSPS
jgi:hypothetical protein